MADASRRFRIEVAHVAFYEVNASDESEARTMLRESLEEGAGSPEWMPAEIVNSEEVTA